MQPQLEKGLAFTDAETIKLRRLHEQVLEGTREAVSLARKSRDKVVLASSLHSLAKAHALVAKSTPALRAVEQAARLFHETGELEAEAFCALVEVQIYNNDMKRWMAKKSADRAIALFQECGNVSGEAFARDVLEDYNKEEADMAAIVRDVVMHQASMELMVDCPLMDASMDFFSAMPMSKESLHMIPQDHPLPFSLPLRTGGGRVVPAR